MAATMNVVTFMGKNFQHYQNSIVNTSDLTLKKMFDISAKFVGEQDEIFNLDKIHWENIHGNIYHWLVMTESSVLNAQKSTSSQILCCVLEGHQHPQSNEAWMNRIEWITSSQSYRDFDGINGEPMEFEWKISPGFTTLQLCVKVSDLLSRLGETPETFTRRILLVSECVANAKVVSILAKKFGTGQWSCIGPSSEKKMVFYGRRQSSRNLGIT